MAEREGFEPSVACTTHDFQSCTFSHSVTSPRPCMNCTALWTNTTETLTPMSAQYDRYRQRTWKGALTYPTAVQCYIIAASLHVIYRALSFTTHAKSAASGESGIRTHGGVAPTPDFESGSFGLSDTSPVFSRRERLVSTRLLAQTRKEGAE